MIAARAVRAVPPARLRTALQQLGPTYVKAGQFLALRPDLVSQEHADALMGLVDRVPPMPWADARGVIEADLGADVRELFAAVDPRPVAAGSLAQTHLARLLDGSDVAVKIQRPGLRDGILRDLARAKVLGRVLALTGIRAVSPEAIVEELRDWLLQELDLRRELRNLVRLRALSRGSAWERIPRPEPELSGERVLVAEYLRGFPVSDVLQGLREDGNGTPGPRRVDAEDLAATLVRATFTQVFSYQFFHADLHPGNLIAMPDGRVGFVDFGLCAELDETVRERQMRYLVAVYAGDVDGMFDAISEILVPREDTDLAAFRRDFGSETRTWLSRIRVDDGSEIDSGEPGGRSPIAEYMIVLLRTARRHGMELPPRVLAMYRALLTAETVAGQLAPGVNLRVVGQRFFRDLEREERRHLLDPERVTPVAFDVLTLLRESPRQLNSVLSGLADGRFALNAKVVETAPTARARDGRARLVALAILSVGASTLVASPVVADRYGAAVQSAFVVLLVLLYLLVLREWRRLR